MRTYVVIITFQVKVDQDGSTLNTVQLEVVLRGAAGDGAGHYVVQQHLLQELHVGGEGLHDGVGNSGEGVVVRSEDCEGS